MASSINPFLTSKSFKLHFLKWILPPAFIYFPCENIFNLFVYIPHKFTSEVRIKLKQSGKVKKWRIRFKRTLIYQTLYILILHFQLQKASFTKENIIWFRHQHGHDWFTNVSWQLVIVAIVFSDMQFFFLVSDDV